MTVCLERAHLTSSAVLRCADRTLDLSRPRVMGIINLHPDSFYQKSIISSVERQIEAGLAMVAEGADMLDIGAEPTNPTMGSLGRYSSEEELDALLPVVEGLIKATSVPISVDTSDPKVMSALLARGVHMINDVRALTREGALSTVAASKASVCLMAMSDPAGTRESFSKPSGQLLEMVINFLESRVAACEAAGISRDRIMIDPGFGAGSFGKSTVQNFYFIRHFERLHALSSPILVGISRKLFIGDALNQPASERLYGTLSLTTILAAKGASIIRTHDVRATREALMTLRVLMEESHG